MPQPPETDPQPNTHRNGDILPTPMSTAQPPSACHEPETPPGRCQTLPSAAAPYTVPSPPTAMCATAPSIAAQPEPVQYQTLFEEPEPTIQTEPSPPAAISIARRAVNGRVWTHCDPDHGAVDKLVPTAIGMEDLVACSDYGRSQHPDRALSADCGIRNATGKRLPIGGRCREALLYGMQPMIIRVSQWREAEKLRNGTTTSRRRISSPNPNVAVRYLGWIY